MKFKFLSTCLILTSCATLQGQLKRHPTYNSLQGATSLLQSWDKAVEQSVLNTATAAITFAKKATGDCGVHRGECWAIFDELMEPAKELLNKWIGYHHPRTQTSINKAYQTLWRFLQDPNNDDTASSLRSQLSSLVTTLEQTYNFLHQSGLNVTSPYKLLTEGAFRDARSVHTLHDHQGNLSPLESRYPGTAEATIPVVE